MNPRNTHFALLLIRIATAGNLLIHGTTRLIHGGVPGFDDYLGSLGFPVLSAWVITGFEVLASIIIIAGKCFTSLHVILY